MSVYKNQNIPTLLTREAYAASKLTIVEQKHKSVYSLTRKEYDNFNVSILKLMGMLFEHSKDYEMLDAVSNFYELITLESFSENHSCEETLDDALMSWDQNMGIWNEKFSSLLSKKFESISSDIKYENYYYSLDLINSYTDSVNSWSGINKALPPLKTFNKSNSDKIISRIKYGYAEDDVEHFKSFIAWHIARACLYYGFIEDSKSWLLFLKPEKLTLEEKEECDYAVKNFVNIIDFMSN